MPEGPDGLPPHRVIATWRAMDAHSDSESMDLVGGSVISILQNQSNRPRLLIIEPDSAARRQLARVFERPCWNPDDPSSALANLDAPSICSCGDTGIHRACCVLIDSLSQLHDLDLSHFDVVLCATELRDGSGLDALVFMHGMRSELSVILIGSEASMAVDAIRGGALDFIVTTSIYDLHSLPLAVEKSLVHQRIKQENERLHTDLKRSLNELAVTNHQLQAVIRQLETMARTDELTGLANRRWLNLMLQGSWAEATRSDLPLACLMIDLDQFKAINDRMGHHRGDELLRLAAKVIRANCRAVDVPARYGGDEFCILMAHTEADEALMVAQRILREFTHATRNVPPEEPPVGMSIGVSHINLSRPINADQLVTHADEALYSAKQAGKNRVMLRQAGGLSEAVNK